MVIDQTTARQIAWEHGIIAAHYLRDDQLCVYEHLHKHRSPFIEASRRYGKTTSVLIYVIERLLANPGWVCRWVLPEKDQARTIVIPEMDKISDCAPDELRPKYSKTGSVYNFPNGSKLFLYGVDKDGGKRLRGPSTNIVVADEFGFWNHPRVLKSVLRPQLLTTRGQLIIASTPPEDTAHPYYGEYEKAQRLGRFLQRTIYDNGSLTQEQIDDEMEEQGGANSATWKREYLCEHVGDPELLVVPEWSDERNIVPDDYPRPDFFDAYVGGDSGVDDNTAYLFGYYDFLKDEAVIEDEYVTNGKTSAEIVAMAKIKESGTWGRQEPVSRWVDGDKQLLMDISITHKYFVCLPEKHDKTAALHRFRERVKQGRFKVKARCKHTIRTLKNGQWANRKHTDFKRSEELGHLDPLSAALYFNRSIITTRNPWPQNVGVSKFTHHINPVAISQDSDANALAEAFRPFDGEIADGFETD